MRVWAPIQKQMKRGANPKTFLLKGDKASEEKCFELIQGGNKPECLLIFDLEVQLFNLTKWKSLWRGGRVQNKAKER